MPFSSFGLHADLIRGVKDLAFTHPTPIQKEAIGPALAGRDVLACAQTGSGKTAAFMLPTLHHLITKPPAPGPRRARVLVLTPTRELAAQILDHLNSMAVHTPISGAAIIGGVGMGPQAHAFRTGTEILVATPGRLLDHMRQSYARLDGLEILIIDEADRMLDMGFLPDIKRILRVVPAKRQTLFFSATMPPEIRKLTLEILHDPVTIQIERQTAPAGGITQAIYPVPQHLKTELLRRLLEHEGLESVIVFTRTKHRANRLAAALTHSGVSCIPIHGNRSQSQRTAALAGFKAGQYRVLVATDIAARGIDIADVSHVINFDCPNIADDYIHRVGRTGRASATGDAFTFVSEEEQPNLRAIERAINKRLPRITLPDFDYTRKVVEKLEIPIAERIAAIRAEKARARARQQASPQYGSHGSPQNAFPGGHPQAPRAHGTPFPGPRGRPQGGPQGGHHGGHGSPGQRSNYDVAAIGGLRSGGRGGGGEPGRGQAGAGHGFQRQKPRQPGGGRGGKFPNRPRGRFSGPAGPRV
jgi:ATP-dependent RNA helicase RhlE